MKRLFLNLSFGLFFLICTSLTVYSQSNTTKKQYDDFLSFNNYYNRTYFNEFIDSINTDKLFFILKDDIFMGLKGRIFEKRIRLMCVLAIDEWKDDRIQIAYSFLEDIYIQPSVIAPSINYNSLIAILNIQAAMAEIGDATSTIHLIRGCDRSYWQETATVDVGVKWNKNDLWDLMTAAVDKVYFLQNRHKLAKQKIEQMRNSNPTKDIELRQLNMIKQFDSGLNPSNRIVPLFYFHPANLWLDDVTCCKIWKMHQ